MPMGVGQVTRMEPAIFGGRECGMASGTPSRPWPHGLAPPWPRIGALQNRVRRLLSASTRRAWTGAWAAALLLVQALLCGTAWAQQTLRVGVYQNPPKVDMGSASGAQGIFVDIIEAIAREQGWTVRYVPGTFREGLGRLERNELDLMADVAITPERQRVFAFHAEPVLHSWSQVYARPGSGIRNILDLAGKRVAVLDGSVQQEFLVQAAASFGVRPELVPFADYRSALRAVEQGRADALVTNAFHGSQHAAAAGLEDTAIIFAPSRLFFAAPKGGDGAILAAIDRHLRASKAEPDSVYFRSLRQWTSFERAPALPWWFKWAAAAGAALLALSLGWVLTLHRATVRLRAAERVQRQLAEGLARIFDRSLDVICVLDARLRFVRVSKASVPLLGYEPRELEGRSALDFLPPADRGKALEGFRRILDGASPQLLESRALRKDGSVAHMVWSVAWSRAQGELYCVARDESERRQLLGRLQARTEELQRANEDLQTFAQSVSHDLRAPLAAITGFVGKVLRDGAWQLADGSRSLLERALAAGARMERLIEDLLRLARLAEQGMHLQDCDLSALAREVTDALRHSRPRAVHVAIEPGLQASADERLLRIALENLLENAWKFTAHVPAPQIAVGREPGEDGEDVFYVRDNGAGFAMEYADRLFAPFQRLHSRAEFEGTGIGLSIVHKVLTRHGGRIWAQGAPGQGAVFRFTLPGGARPPG